MNVSLFRVWAAALAVLGLTLVVGCGGGGSDDGGDIVDSASAKEPKGVKVRFQDSLENKVRFDLEDHLSLNSVKVTDQIEQKMGGGVKMTEFKFVTSVTTKEPLYSKDLERDGRNRVAFAEIQTAAGESFSVNGTGNYTKLPDSGETLYINFDYNAFNVAGVRQSKLNAYGNEVIVKGSERHTAFLAELEAKKANQQASIQAQFDAQKKKLEEHRQQQEADAQARRDAENADLIAEADELNKVPYAIREKTVERLIATKDNFGAIYMMLEKDGLAFLDNLEPFEDLFKARLVYVDKQTSEPVVFAWGGAPRSFSTSKYELAGRPLIGSTLLIHGFDPEAGEIMTRKIHSQNVPDTKISGGYDEATDSIIGANYRGKSPTLISFQDANQRELKAELAKRLKPFGPVELMPEKQILLGGRLTDIDSGAFIVPLYQRDAKISPLDPLALVTDRKAHFRPGRVDSVTIKAEPKRFRDLVSRQIIGTTGNRAITFSNGDFFLETVDPNTEAVTTKPITQIGVFSGSPLNPRLFGDWFSFTRREDKSLVEINVSDGEIRQTPEADLPDYRKSSSPTILGKYMIGQEGDVIFAYDMSQAKELRLNSNISRSGRTNVNLFTQNKAEIAPGIFFFPDTFSFVDFKNLTAYTLKDSLPTQSESGALSLSPSKTQMLIGERDAGGFRYHLHDLSTGARVRTLGPDFAKLLEKMGLSWGNNIMQEAIKQLWVDDSGFVMQVTKGSLNDLGLWAYDIETSKVTRLHGRVASVGSLRYSPIHEKLFFLENTQGEVAQSMHDQIMSPKQNIAGTVLHSVKLDGTEHEKTEVLNVSYKASINLLFPADYEHPSKNLFISGKSLRNDAIKTDRESILARLKAQSDAPYEVLVKILEKYGRGYDRIFLNEDKPFDDERALEASFDLLFGAARKQAFVDAIRKLDDKHASFHVYAQQGKTPSDVKRFEESDYKAYLSQIRISSLLPLPKRSEGTLSAEQLELVEKLLGENTSKQEYLSLERRLPTPQVYSRAKLEGFYKARANDFFESEYRNVKGDRVPFVAYMSVKLAEATMADLYIYTNDHMGMKSKNRVLENELISDWNNAGGKAPAGYTSAAAPSPSSGATNSNSLIGGASSNGGSEPVNKTKEQKALETLDKKAQQTVEEINEAADAVKNVFKGLF